MDQDVNAQARSLPTIERSWLKFYLGKIGSLLLSPHVYDKGNDLLQWGLEHLEKNKELWIRTNELQFARDNPLFIKGLRKILKEAQVQVYIIFGSSVVVDRSTPSEALNPLLALLEEYINAQKLNSPWPGIFRLFYINKATDNDIWISGNDIFIVALHQPYARLGEKRGGGFENDWFLSEVCRKKIWEVFQKTPVEITSFQDISRPQQQAL